jgi:hypothetical protein
MIGQPRLLIGERGWLTIQDALASDMYVEGTV